MTALNILIKNGVFQTEDVNQRFNLDVTRDCYIKTQKDIVKSMQEYAKEKCKELLEILIEKAEVKTVTIPNGLNIKTCAVNRDSILNAVDLDSFIS
jgi:hypothetical protein